MKKVLNFSGFLSEQDDYNKDLENDLVRKNAKSVAAGEEREEEEEEVDADEIADDDSGDGGADD